MNIVKEVKKLNLPLGEYVVIGSGTMAALGIREARDIDITVTSKLHTELRMNGEWKEEERYGKIFLKKGTVEINPELNWKDYPTTTENAIVSALLIEGIPFLNLDELKKFKKALGRPKDFKDLDLIERYIKNKD